MIHLFRFTQCLLLMMMVLLADGGAVRCAALEIAQSDAEVEKQLIAAVKEAEGSGPKDPRLATALDKLAGFYETHRRYSEAEKCYQRSLDIRKNALGPQHLSVAVSLNNLARLQQDQGKYDRAEALHWLIIAFIRSLRV